MAVLIKGKSIKCTQSSRDHYLRGSENERITPREVLGFATKDPDEALQMIEIMAKGSRCTKPVYSAKINPESGRIWNKEEIRRAIELLEQNLGLSGHPRVVVEHKKKGRVHFHVLWSRYHPDGGPAVKMANDYAIHQRTQRQIEQAFKLRPMMAKGTDFKHSEVEWAKRYGYDILKLRDQITTDFKKVTSGQEFMASLKEKGCVVCRGDKSQFVLILPWGQHKALSSMIYGRPTKAVLRRALGDIDITKLPTVQEGKATVKARLPKALSRSAVRNAAGVSGGRGLTTSITTKKQLTRRAQSSAAQQLQRLAKAAFRLAAKSTITDRPSQPMPAPIKPIAINKKGWPTAAIIAWDTWGKHDPVRFFRIWSELSTPGLTPK